MVKLNEASLQRANQARDLAGGDRIIERLVCPEGVQATTAILLNGADQIPPVKKMAVIWFSDLSGYAGEARQHGLDYGCRAVRYADDNRTSTLLGIAAAAFALGFGLRRPSLRGGAVCHQPGARPRIEPSGTISVAPT